MVVVMFRSRLKGDVDVQAYDQKAADMADIATQMEGYISHRDYVAEDGERVSIHEWRSEADLKAWREHPAHRKIQAWGRETLYESYTLWVCDTPRVTEFRNEPG